MKPKSADILVTNGTVLTLDAGNTEIINGAVAIAKDTITAVGLWRMERITGY
jgi:predicted amidohydrolase YtcJ